MNPFSEAPARPRRVALCMGTRPEIIKMAPVYHALRQTGLEPLVVHTGQHDDLAYPLYRFFDMMPAAEVDLHRARPTLGHLTANLVEGVDLLLGQLRPDALLVHGDTTSALSAALVGLYNQIPVGHVEAGLRSGHNFDPFPEEQNRQLIARIATWHFAPTQRAVENLVGEGIPAKAIHLVGNTVVDAAKWGERRLVSHFTREGRPPVVVSMAPLARKRLMLVTAHRRENWGAPLARIAQSVVDIVKRHADMTAVWPMHPNPDVKRVIEATFAQLTAAERKRVLLCEPLAYPQLLWVLQQAWVVLTDSGGIQEEAAAFRRPVLVLRNTTERPELIEQGGGVLVGTDARVIGAWVDQLIADPDAYRSLQCTENPFGDGRAGRYIAGILEQALVPEQAAPAAPECADLPPVLSLVKCSSGLALAA